MQINVSSIVNNPWTVIGTVATALWWVAENKPSLPDVMEPQTIAEDKIKYDPLQTQVNMLSADMLDRNIPWALEKLDENTRGLDSGYTTLQLYNYLCGTMERQGQYRRYEKLHGTKHFSEGDFCE